MTVRKNMKKLTTIMTDEVKSRALSTGSPLVFVASKTGMNPPTRRAFIIGPAAHIATVRQRKPFGFEGYVSVHPKAG
jgi:hypothetical protein